MITDLNKYAKNKLKRSLVKFVLQCRVVRIDLLLLMSILLQSLFALVS